MLSDEEKKAIDNMKSLLLYSKEHEYFSPFQEQEIDDMNIVLNLIEKQSKQIEEYKKQLDLDYVDEHFVPIERYNQLEKEIEELKNKNKKLKDKAKELIFEKQELTSALLDSTPNDKIKAKIEPVLKQLERKMEEEYNKYGNSREYQDVVDAYNFLQSLLEKEGE